MACGVKLIKSNQSVPPSAARSQRYPYRPYRAAQSYPRRSGQTDHRSRRSLPSTWYPTRSDDHAKTPV